MLKACCARNVLKSTMSKSETIRSATNRNTMGLEAVFGARVFYNSPDLQSAVLVLEHNVKHLFSLTGEHNERVLRSGSEIEASEGAMLVARNCKKW